MALILTTRSLDTPQPMPQQLRLNTETEVMSPSESVTGNQNQLCLRHRDTSVGITDMEDYENTNQTFIS